MFITLEKLSSQESSSFTQLLVQGQGVEQLKPFIYETVIAFLNFQWNSEGIQGPSLLHR